MAREVVRRSRHAETAEIIRAGERPPVEQRQAPLDQRTVAQLAGPKDAIGDEMPPPIGDFNTVPVIVS
jgi:hypothetical protein